VKEISALFTKFGGVFVRDVVISYLNTCYHPIKILN